MKSIPAVVLHQDQLSEMLVTAGRVAAREIAEAFKEDLKLDPTDQRIKKLRDYIADRTTCTNPKDEWANGRHIRMIAPAKEGKPKSMGWFQQFKKKSKLNKCYNRKSADHGHLQEWCFEDIANAWVHYHQQK